MLYEYDRQKWVQQIQSKFDVSRVIAEQLLEKQIRATGIDVNV